MSHIYEGDFVVNAGSREETESLGYAVFNRGPHLRVDIPNGWSTITCKLANGKMITFTFIPYEKDGVPQCVDISARQGGPMILNGGQQVEVQNVIVFSAGNWCYSTPKVPVEKSKMPTLTTVLLTGAWFEGGTS